jgi:hypothetical protein
MKKKLYNFFVYISLALINLFIKINSPKLCAFIILLNIRKLKIIKSNSKNPKKILIFPKSNGTEDIVESFKNKKSNIIFFLLPRPFLQKIFICFFDKSYCHDYFTKLTKLEDIKKKNLYVSFLTLTFTYVEYFIQFDGFISFNLLYYAEKHFEVVCQNLNKKFIILHKESALTPTEEKIAPEIYNKFNDKSLSYKISVYSESQKKILIKSNIAHKNQIVVVGTPRSDYAFKLRKISPKEKVIIFYLIEYNRSTAISGPKVKNWNKLYNQTLKYLFEFAKNNPNIQIILKGKTGVHEKEESNLKTLPKNCRFIDGGSGHSLLRNASAVIAFNSTIVFETIASNRNLIIPNFNGENKVYRNILHKIENKNYFVNSKIQFNRKIKLYLDLDYKKKNLLKPDIKTLKYYLGNINATAGSKLRKFVEKTIN